MQRPGLEARPAKIETRFSVAVDEAMNETRELQARSHEFSSPVPIRAASAAVIMTILPSLAISTRAISTPAHRTAFTARVMSPCRNVEWARATVRVPTYRSLEAVQAVADRPESWLVELAIDRDVAAGTSDRRGGRG